MVLPKSRGTKRLGNLPFYSRLRMGPIRPIAPILLNLCPSVLFLKPVSLLIQTLPHNGSLLQFHSPCIVQLSMQPPGF